MGQSNLGNWIKITSARTIVDRRSSALSTDPDLKPQPHVQPQLTAAPNNTQSVPMDELLEIEERIELNATQGSATLAGKVKVNDSYFKHTKLKFEYWPDAMNNPGLKMTIASGGGSWVNPEQGRAKHSGWKLRILNHLSTHSYPMYPLRLINLSRFIDVII